MTYKFERIHNEQSGQLQKIDGTRFDLAAFMETKSTFDLDVGALNGSIYETFYRNTSLAAGASLFFYQEVDSTELIRGLGYKQILRGGPVTFQLLVGCTLGAVQETRDGYNVDRRRFVTGNSWTALSPIKRVDSLTGGVVIDEWFAESSGGFFSQSTATTEEIGITGIYDGMVFPCFSVTNNDTTVIDIELSWVWKELVLDS